MPLRAIMFLNCQN